MKVLFATTNPAKVKKFADALAQNGIELITAKDLNIDIHVDECGKNALENAYIKAKTYYDIAKIPTIGMDNNLFIENIPEEKQPGTHVRRIGNKELNDDEMIEYYTTLVKENGIDNKLMAKWVYGMVIYDGIQKHDFSWSKEHFYFVTKPSNTRNPGYPLDSISIIPDYNKYLVDLTQEERNQYNVKDKTNDVIEFIVKTLKKG